MRILHVNKFAYARGGAEIYMLRTAQKQAANGHVVGIFGDDLGEYPLGRAVRHFPFEVLDFHAARGASKLKAAVNVLWSEQAKQSLLDAIDRFGPDVVHLHNYAHQLSTSIVSGLRSSGVRSVYTAHDYKLICPAYVASIDGADCFSCSKKLSRRLLLERCHQGSLSWSALVGVESALVRTSGLIPDRIVAPSRFMRDALASSWMEGAAISLLRNPVESSSTPWVGDGGYLLFVGRLSREKGVDKLVTACASLRQALVIAGDGPLRSELEAQALTLGAPVTIVGHVGEAELAELRERCIAQVVSSTWPENAPLSALEAAADGVPLIVTSRGGLPEFSEIGAKAVSIAAVTEHELGAAIAALPQVLANPALFHRETSWEPHLARLDSIYRGDE